MKKEFTILAFSLLLIFAPGFSGVSLSSDGTEQSDVAAVVKGNNTFAFDLYAAVTPEKGNLFLSPYSISSALAMTYAGARGQTAAQMKKTLHFDLADIKLNSGFSELMKTFNASDKKYQLSVANALWGQRGTKFYPDFVRTVKTSYDAGFQEVDYIHNTEQARQTINKWVEAKTNHKIVELIKPKILNELTRLVLTNAIYFKGRWESQFKPGQTEKEPFYAANGAKTKIPLMHQVGKFNYVETDQTQILELPYQGGEVAMDILLPNSRSDFSKMESRLQSAEFETGLAKMAPRTVDVFLPRFKLEKDFTLNDPLIALGMKDAFDENKADFLGMSQTFLYITRVVHKAFLEVNEEGTEAAAATAVIVGTKSAPMEIPVVFRADHPFFFLIRDLRSGSILFMGRMVEP